MKVRKRPFLEELTTYIKNFIINLSGFKNGGKRIGFSKPLSIGSADHLISMLKVKLSSEGAGLDQRSVLPYVSQKTCGSNVNWTQNFCLDSTLQTWHNSTCSRSSTESSIAILAWVSIWAKWPCFSMLIILSSTAYRLRYIAS